MTDTKADPLRDPVGYIHPKSGIDNGHYFIEMAVSYEDAAKLFSYDPISGAVVRIAPGPDYGKTVRSVDGQGYMRTRIGKPYFQLHRIAWLLSYREWPKSRLDHRDGNRTNNALSNLREEA